MVAFYEVVFILSCLLTLFFTTEFIYGNFQINKNIGIVVCSLLLLTLIAGTAFIGYSIWWQISFNRRRFVKRNENAAFYEQEKPQKELTANKVLTLIEEEDEDSDESEDSSKVSYTNIRAA